MVNENLIPKTETVYELKNEIPSYEEFIKTYKVDKVLEDNYEAEWKDKVLYGPQYGPGNTMSSENKVVAKTVGGVALTTLTIICPPAGLAVGAGVAASGATMAVAGAIDKDSELIMDGFDVFAMGMGSAVKGGSGSNSHKGYVCGNPICPKR